MSVAEPADILAPESPCRQCGYDLRGQPRDGRCPECGAAVDDTTVATDLEAAGRPVPLSLANQRWARTVARGATVIPAAGLALAGVGLIGNLRGSGGDPSPVVRTALMVGMLASLAALAVGAWCVSTAEPYAAPVRRSMRAARLGARWGLPATVAAVVALVAAPMGLAVKLFLGVPWIVNLTGLTATVGCLHLAMTLARRLGRPRLARWAALGRWAAVGIAVAESLFSNVPVGPNNTTVTIGFPVVGDAFAPGLLWATERADPRADVTVCVLAAGAVVFVGTIVVWSAIARSSRRKAAPV